MKTKLFCIPLILLVVAVIEAKDSSRRYQELGELMLNQIQVIGSHNSYKKAIDPELLQSISKESTQLASSLDYSHMSISGQLSLGLCNLEIDVYLDSDGGKYASPKGLDLIEHATPYDPQQLMMQPGFKVFHIPEVDFRSHCLTLKQYLGELKKWSLKNPEHLPIFITLEFKDKGVERPGFTVPEKCTPDGFDQLDEALVRALGMENLIIPDQVRGHYDTLEQAILDGQWPSLKEARGKFIFILDDSGEKRDMYVQDHPSLEGRILFVNAQAGQPEAAFMILNDPIHQFSEIREFVEKGYIIRTRADAGTVEARVNDTKRFEAARRSGAQIITTDYYRESEYFNSDYKVCFEEGVFFRINTVTTH